MIIWFFTIPTWIILIIIVLGAAAAEAAAPVVFGALDLIITIVILASVPAFWVYLISLVKGEYEGDFMENLGICIFHGLVAFFGTNLLISNLVG